MPFDPVTGAWSNPVDRPYSLPTTSAGDIIGGFQSYSAYEREQERQKLAKMIQQLQLDKGTYDFERQQYEDTQFDEFSRSLPGMNPDQAEQAILGLANPTKAQSSLGSINAQRDRQRVAEAKTMMVQLQRAIQDGSMDPMQAGAQVDAAFPDYPHLGNSLRMMKTKPTNVGKSELMAAQTDNLAAKTEHLRKMSSLLVQSQKLRNDWQRAKNKVGPNAGSGSTDPYRAAKFLAALHRSRAAILASQRNESFTNQILKSDDPEYAEINKQIEEELAAIDSTIDMVESGLTPQAAQPKANQGDVPPPGATIIDLTK